MNRLSSEELFFPVDVFRGPNRLFDSVSDAECHDIKILTRFPGKPILEILIKNFDKAFFLTSECELSCEKFSEFRKTLGIQPSYES